MDMLCINLKENNVKVKYYDDSLVFICGLRKIKLNK